LLEVQLEINPSKFTHKTFFTFLNLLFIIKRFNEERYKLKLCCNMRFQHVFTACGCVFKVITLFLSSQSNYFKNATTCSKITLRTRVATQLKKPGRISIILGLILNHVNDINMSAWETLKIAGQMASYIV